MLIGRYASKISVKGRVAVPVKLREELGTTAIIAQGYERSLLLVRKEKWSELTSFLSDKPFIVGNARDTERFLYGSAFDAEFDDQGRIVIPQELRAFAGLAGEAVFLGLGNRVEIWARERWETYQQHLNDHVEHIAESLVQGVSQGVSTDMSRVDQRSKIKDQKANSERKKHTL